VDDGGHNQQPTCAAEKTRCAKDEMDAIFHAFLMVQMKEIAINIKKAIPSVPRPFKTDSRLSVIFHEDLARKW
jgi:hypothetical protein